MSTTSADSSWATSQLVEFLGVLSEQPDEANARRAAVERVLESLDAEVGILVGASRTPVVIGLRPGDDPAPLIAAARVGATSVHIAGLGRCRSALAAFDIGDDAARLFVARAGSDDFCPDETLLLRGMAWVLDLALRPLRVATALHERQRVLEHLAQVQRAIANRVPLPEVFDKVTESALSLLGSDLAILHLADRDELAIVSVSATSEAHLPPPWVLRVSSGIAQEVYQRDDFVRTEVYPKARSMVPELGALGARAAIGAPVRENGTVVGSLVVYSFEDGHTFAPAQEQALLTFADQISVALSDAKTLATAQHAVRDPVVGLPTRIVFLERLERALAAGKGVHVLFLDLDRFKLVNDTLGHAAGDDLLRQVGRRLKERLRGEDFLARFGGDEYAVLMENASDAAVRQSGEEILSAFQEPYLVASEQVVVGGSIGVASGRGATTASEILRDADTAMYRSKHAGGGRIVVFEPRMHTALVQRRSIEADLRHTVDTAALRVEFQPIVNLYDYQIHSAEALVRWDHPIRGAVAPADFIPLAEETGLIVPLGRQVLAEACAEADTWPQGADGRSPYVSVNISARQLLDLSFVADLHHILADSTLDPTRLILEITESTIVSDLDSTLEVLCKIREMGVRLAIDDFGTGYSSLSYLRMLPVDILKIDRSFVENIVVSRQGTAFVRAIVRLAKALSMTAVAEGVETQEQAHALREVGCNLGQGFLFAAPMPCRRLLSVFDEASKGAMPALQP